MDTWIALKIFIVAVLDYFKLIMLIYINFPRIVFGSVFFFRGAEKVYRRMLTTVSIFSLFLNVHDISFVKDV